MNPLVPPPNLVEFFTLISVVSCLVFTYVTLKNKVERLEEKVRDMTISHNDMKQDVKSIVSLLTSLRVDIDWIKNDMGIRKKE
jgi:hypothetical protein